MQRLLLTGLSLLLLACSTPSSTQFYTLDAVLPVLPQKNLATEKHRTIGIGPITLPALLNRKALVTHDAQHRIHLSETEQWAEPLVDTITRVLARNLATLHPSATLHTYPWTAFGQVDTRIVIEITQFEVQPGKRVTFDAVWSINDDRLQHPLKQGHFIAERPLKNTDTHEWLTQMNALLAAFSTELSKALE